MRSLPATGLAEAHAVYGISLDPVSARLAVISVWHEDGKRCEREATGATPEEALTCLEQALLAEIQDPDTLTAARAAVVAARESREEIPPNLRRPEV